MQSDIGKHIYKVAYIMIGLLVVLFLYICYIQVVQSDFLASHPLNYRSVEAANRMERGHIFDCKGETLAASLPNGKGSYMREYPEGAIFAHVVGYDSKKYGKYGVESSYNGYLSGIANTERSLGPINRFFTSTKGSNVYLTLDSQLQNVAYQALGNRKGAIIAMSPKTGAVLVMVSKPSFNPNTLENNWQSLSQSQEGILLNRVVQGLYPPGSALKIMIAEAALKEKVATTTTSFVSEGSLKIGNYTLSEYNNQVHGKLNLSEALAVSSNVVFGKLALSLGRDKMAKTFDRYGFNEPVTGAINETSSRLPEFARLGDGDLAQTGIGQGSLLITPLRMALLTSAIANKGTIMKPYIVSKITTADGSLLKSFSPEQLLNPTSPELANIVAKMMVGVVDYGTGKSAAISKVNVAGKTGTAENPHGDSHAWFVGFAPIEDPQLVVAIIVENGGSGGAVAAPIARQLFLHALH